MTATDSAAAPAVSDSQRVPVVLTVNGARYSLELDPRTSLLDALRENLALTGSKKGCDHGQCGACTVLLAGRRVNACLMLALMAEGDEVTTIEGLPALAARDRRDPAVPGALHPMQQAFISHDGFQCGYCTPGQICSAAGMLQEVRHGMPSHVTADLERSHTALTREEIRERMSGNLCRCGAYPNIVDAIAEVAAGDNR